MLVKMKTSMADSLGRSYKPKGIYEMEDEEALRLIEAGFCAPVEADPEQLCEILRATKFGLFVLPDSDEGIIEAAKEAKVKLLKFDAETQEKLLQFDPNKQEIVVRKKAAKKS